MKIYSLASGSKGNCFLIKGKNTCLLIDLGISNRALGEKLKEFNITKQEIDAVLLTHEHDDHIKGLRVFTKCEKTIVYAHEKVFSYLIEKNLISDCEKENINSDVPFFIKDAKIIPFELSHDSISCHGYRIEMDGCTIIYLTDTGYVPENVYKYFDCVDYAIIESNHDERMLMLGPYQEYLKERILSSRGHLSNEQAGEICKLLKGKMVKSIMIAHLSEINNEPILAKSTIMKYLEDDCFDVKIADQYYVVKLVDYD